MCNVRHKLGIYREYWFQEVSGCVVVNPERLAKGAVGGTFARLTLNLTDKTEHVCKSISAQIIRI